MRVIGGEFGGRRLTAPQGDGTRPTADRVREALFSILGPPTPDGTVLDLFAGAGTLGLEALSRGACRAVFVESTRRAADCLAKNIAALGVADRCEVYSGDARRLLARLKSEGRQFAWIFLDPPYRSELGQWALAQLGAGDLVGAGAVVVCEHDRRNPPADRYGHLGRFDQRAYGDTNLSLYRRSAGDAL